MCKKLICLVSIVLVLGLVGNAVGQTGTGLRAEYYHFSGSSPPSREDAFRDLVFSRIEPQIYCYWNPGFVANHPDGLTPALEIPPPPGVRSDTFAVRWTGEIEALNTEAYTFITGADDGVRVYLNGELIIDDWADHDRTETTADPVELVAGQRYPIVVEGYENGGEAEWQLYWQSASTPREVVPQRVLYPALKRQDFLASKPVPADSAVIRDTWYNMNWAAGAAAVSHDVYFGDDFDYVNTGTGDTFRGNQAAMDYIVGFPGFPYPEGLAQGTTYYWRIDEVNELNPESPWKGNVWSFTVAPRTAFAPEPANGAESVEADDLLRWEPGFDAKLHYVFFGDNFDDVNSAAMAPPTGHLSYSPGPLELEKVYFWRIDEFDGIVTHKGEVWSFTTLGAVGSPSPAFGAVDVKHTKVLKWSPGDHAASHQVYFGTDEGAVRNANTGSPEYKGTRELDSESYDPGKLDWETTYYWRIDEVNNLNPNSPWTGNVWNFTTADFLVIDDFEDYDAGENQIWYAWKDGLGFGTPGTDPYYAGNGSGSAVGDESTPSYTSESIVHTGGQALPFLYDNDKQGFFQYSEAVMTLDYPRDWTEREVNKLVIWFRGEIFNSLEQMYVVLNDNAVVNHSNPEAVSIGEWAQWTIDLQEFADQGVDLTNVNTIGIGVGNRSNPQAGGSGTMYFDDIRLYPPPPEPEPEP
jgi:hypothetical protein